MSRERKIKTAWLYIYIYIYIYTYKNRKKEEIKTCRERHGEIEKKGCKIREDRDRERK